MLRATCQIKDVNRSLGFRETQKLVKRGIKGHRGLGVGGCVQGASWKTTAIMQAPEDGWEKEEEGG